MTRVRPSDEDCTLEDAIAAVRKAAWVEEPNRDDALDVVGKAIASLDSREPTAGRLIAARTILAEFQNRTGRTMIHTSTGFGCDLGIEDAVKRLQEADRIVWSTSLIGHDLAAIGPGDKAMRFDVLRPKAEEES